MFIQTVLNSLDGFQGITTMSSIQIGLAQWGNSQFTENVPQVLASAGYIKGSSANSFFNSSDFMEPSVKAGFSQSLAFSYLANTWGNAGQFVISNSLAQKKGLFGFTYDATLAYLNTFYMAQFPSITQI